MVLSVDRLRERGQRTVQEWLGGQQIANQVEDKLNSQVIGIRAG